MKESSQSGDARDIVYEAAERGEMTIAGLRDPVEPGAHGALFAGGVPGDYKIFDLRFDWHESAVFTYSIDETFFDDAYVGWGHWSNGELLVTWIGGHLHEENGHTATIVDGVDDEDEAGPTRPDWWHRLFVQIMDVMDQPDQRKTIGQDRHT